MDPYGSIWILSSPLRSLGFFLLGPPRSISWMKSMPPWMPPIARPWPIWWPKPPGQNGPRSMVNKWMKRKCWKLENYGLLMFGCRCLVKSGRTCLVILGYLSRNFLPVHDQFWYPKWDLAHWKPAPQLSFDTFLHSHHVLEVDIRCFQMFKCGRLGHHKWFWPLSDQRHLKRLFQAAAVDTFIDSYGRFVTIDQVSCGRFVNMKTSTICSMNLLTTLWGGSFPRWNQLGEAERCYRVYQQNRRRCLQKAVGKSPAEAGKESEYFHFWKTGPCFFYRFFHFDCLDFFGPGPAASMRYLQIKPLRYRLKHFS